MLYQLLRTPRAWFLVLWCIHIGLCASDFPLNGFTNNLPIGQKDYNLHFYGAFASSQVFYSSQHVWGYDPYFMAGYPVGVLLNLDNRLIELVVTGLSWLGEARAFNLVLFLMFALLPLAIYGAARNWSLDGWTTLGAVALAMMVWRLEPYVANMWQIGTISFLTASYASPFVLSLFEKYIQQKSTAAWLWLAIATFLLSLVHGFALFILIVPAFVLYVGAWRQLAWHDHLALIALVLLVLLGNLYWLAPTLHYLPLIETTSPRLQGGIESLADDVRGILWLENGTLSATAGLRWSIWLLGLAGTFLWWRETRARGAIVIGAALVSFVLVAYGGVFSSSFSALEPFRYVVPATLFACFPTAFILSHTLRKSTWFPRDQRWRLRPVLVLIVALLVLANAARAIAADPARLQTDELSLPTKCHMRLFKWIEKNTSSEARILVQDLQIGSRVPFFVRRQLIGGRHIPAILPQIYANADFKAIFGERISRLDNARLKEYLDTFNVKWIISDNGKALGGSLSNYIELNKPPFLESVDKFCDYWVFQTTFEPSFFLRGSGKVEADYNKIRVTGASTGSVIIKYHWLDTLRTDPPMKLTAVPVLNDPVGFIQVENGSVRNFLIYNAYTY